ncbi:MAG TPA: aldehyde ferredoxin oxidoreductase C-terminal domain-containing protein [Nitrospirota bacterium]|nr:aldehyde ferredoxin oxidoreductase C-terminal domain-containing protein [Nitrospirota bacterium]
MIRDQFRVLIVDLATSKGTVVMVEGRDNIAGGSGLAAVLFNSYGHFDRPWNDPDQPLIFAIGPLTGYFPLMSKTVGAFKSPYHDQYAESHGGGRSALSLRFADLDALVIKGRAPRPSCLAVGSRHLEVKEVHYLWGKDLFFTGKMLRKMYTGTGHRSILRIGPAGEHGSAMAGINVDSYRHFGRLGGGAVMGSKNLKGIVIQGDGSIPLMESKDYPKLFQEVHAKLTTTDMMSKYHNLGTPANVAVLNEIKALPIRNLQQSFDPGISGITGEKFADLALLRNAACAGCPVGCIHIGFVRERFQEENRYLYRQVSYDYEPIFAMGAMLSIQNCFAVLGILDVVEKMGLDVMSAGVALAWATEATEKGLLTQAETIVPLSFGDTEAYTEAIVHLAHGANEFYRALAHGTLMAAERYGGSDFACVLGQEMGGYATGEVFYTSQALGFRHSHLDAAGYTYDQKETDKDPIKAADFLIKDEQGRVLHTSMVACLFARSVYTDELLSNCLKSVGYDSLAHNLDTVSQNIQKLRWKTRFSSGFKPETVTIPKRFSEISNWKGAIDTTYLRALMKAYTQRILKLGKGE